MIKTFVGENSVLKVQDAGVNVKIIILGKKGEGTWAVAYLPKSSLSEFTETLLDMRASPGVDVVCRNQNKMDNSNAIYYPQTMKARNFFQGYTSVDGGIPFSAPCDFEWLRENGLTYLMIQ